MSDYTDYIWAELYNFIGNEYGTAGLIGNLQAESGNIPYRLQGDFTNGYYKSINYTNNVNDGTISRSDFISDQKGYGLAQWTFSTRKADLYDMYVNGGYSSIGDVSLGVAFLIHELSTSYTGVLNVLRSTTSIAEASNIVLHQFENPQEQGPAVEAYRQSLSTDFYNQYADGTLPPIPVPPDPPTPEQPSIPYWLLFKMKENT